MKKRIISLLICLIMTVGLLPVAVNAADLPFTDVKTDAWYYNDIKIAYEGGLINGKSATVFDPDANLTYAEAVKLAACMHQKSTTGEVTLKNGDPWYQSYVDYCRENGIIGKDKTYEWNTKATRAGYMAIFAYALPDGSLSAVNSVADGSIPDVPMNYPEAKEIYKLYRAGILQGVNSKYNCNPDANIKRSEVAAILTRMMNADKRLSFTIETTEALTITSQPQDAIVASNEPFSFSVTVSGGKAPYKYQWNYTKENLSTWNDAQCYKSELTGKASDYTVKYQCVITDADGNQVTSNIVGLIEKTASLTITSQPETVTTSAGSKVLFSVAVSGGDAPYTYEWQYCEQGIYWRDIEDSADAWSYGDNILSVMAYKNTWMVNDEIRCVVWDASGNSVTSESVRAILAAEPLTITSQPKDVTASAGSKVTFSVAVSGGKAPYTYTWQYCEQGYYWKDIKDSSDAWSYGDSILSVMAYKNTWMVNDDIRCVVRDADGNSVTSNSVKVILEAEPLTITTQPQNATVAAGTKVVMSVTVSGGKAPYTYTWQSYSQGRWETIPDSSDAWSYGGDTLYIMAYRNTWMVNESIHCVVRDANGNTVTSNTVKISLK